MSKRDNHVAAEYARSLAHLGLMQGMLCWDSDGVWIINGQIAQVHGVWVYLAQPEAPTINTLEASLSKPSRLLLDTGRMGDFTFHLRSLPAPKELATLAQTGTPPLRKYRGREMASFYTALKQRHLHLQTCLHAWEAVQQGYTEPRNTIPLAALAYTDRPLSTSKQANKRDSIAQLVQLLEESELSQVGAMALCHLATFTAAKTSHIPPAWQPWWSLLARIPKQLPLAPHKLPLLWPLLTAHHDNPSPTALDWIFALPEKVQQEQGIFLSRLAHWKSPAFAWKLWSDECCSLLTPAQKPDHTNTHQRFGEFLHVLRAYVREDKPSGRFEDIKLQKALVALAGTAQQKARGIVGLLLKWLGQEPLMQQAGATRKMTKALAQAFHMDHSQLPIHALGQWNHIRAMAEKEQARNEENRPPHQEANLIYQWVNHELNASEKAAQKKKKKKKKQDQEESRRDLAYDEAGYDINWNDTPQPFAPVLSPELARFLELPSAQEVPLDRRGWSEWLWHRSWQLPPGARAMVWHELQQYSNDYATPAAYHLWGYEPAIAAESFSNPIVESLLLYEGNFEPIKCRWSYYETYLYEQFENAFLNCSLDPAHIRALVGEVQRAAMKRIAHRTEDFSINDYPQLPTGMVQCSPDEIIDMNIAIEQALVTNIARCEAQETDTLETPVGYRRNCHFGVWWRSMLRCGDFTSVRRVLAHNMPLFQAWGAQAAALHHIPGSASLLRGLLRQATTETEETLALALGQQGNAEDAWPLLVRLRKRPESLSLLVAIERCGDEAITKQAFDAFEPDVPSLLTLHHLAMESRCPTLHEALRDYILVGVEDTSLRGETLDIGNISLALWMLASDKDNACMDQALQALSQRVPQSFPLTMRTAFEDLRGVYRSILTTQGHLKDATAPLLEWLDVYDVLGRLKQSRLKLPPRIRASMWEHLWSPSQRFGLEQITDALWNYDQTALVPEIILAMGDRLERLSDTLLGRFAQRLSHCGHNISSLALLAKCAMAAKAPQHVCHAIDIYHWSEPARLLLWRSLTTPETELGQLATILCACKCDTWGRIGYIGERIHYVESWLPPDEAAPHLRKLLGMRFPDGVSNPRRVEWWVKMLAGISTFYYDEDCYSSIDTPTSYRVQSAIIDDYILVGADVESSPEVALEEDGLSGEGIDPEDKAALLCYFEEHRPSYEHPRIRWLLEQLHVDLP